MSETKWTPGPWQAGGCGDDWSVYKGIPAEAIVAEVLSEDMGLHYNAEANARLIAVAPKLAEFVTRLIDDSQLDLGWREEAEDLMAQARGET